MFKGFLQKRCSQKFRKIHRKKKQCQSLFFNKIESLNCANLLNKGLWHRCFPVNFSKFRGKPVFTEHLRWLLLTLRCTVKHQLISLKYFKTHITQIYISRSSIESSFRTPYTYLVLQQRRIQNPFKHLSWLFFCVSS